MKRTEQLVDQAVELYQSGLGLHKIAKQLGFTHGTIRNWILYGGLSCRQIGRPPGSRNKNAGKHISVVREMRDLGMKFVEIGKELGFTRQRAHQIWKQGFEILDGKKNV